MKPSNEISSIMKVSQPFYCNRTQKINQDSFKWRILSQPGKIGSGKNIFFLIFPTGLQLHLEDMF